MLISTLQAVVSVVMLVTLLLSLLAASALAITILADFFGYKLPKRRSK